MLARGAKLNSQRSMTLYDPKDVACYFIFERWQFATLSQNEVDPPEPEEEIYERGDGPKNLNQAQLTECQLLSSWGLSDEVVDSLGNVSDEEQRKMIEKFSLKDQSFYKVYDFLKPMRGPYNWTRSWENFGELLVDRFRDEIDPEIVYLKFSRIKTANQAFLKINETLIEVNVLPKNIGITTFKNLEFETKVSHAKSIPSLEMQFEKVEVIKDIFRNLSQPEIQLETFEISPDVWPLEKTQINLRAL